ncbi:MAG: zinc ribbon domain-containing protein [Lachnospiraceae bacterium]|nr:zinc ribbon domain-containing protein [Lachnospiraceae bacterium]
MICPKCGTEYREGFNECAYCHIPLVESLEEGVDPEELLKKSESNEPDEVEISPEDFISLARSKGLSERDILNAMDLKPDPETVEERAAALKPFRKAAERAEDLRSSAYTLLIVGVLGLIAVLLLYFGAFPIQFTGAGKYMVTGTMAVLFLLFLIIGINSYRKIQPLREEAEREEKKIEEISRFFFDTYTAESLDREALGRDRDEVGEYFLRSSFIKKCLNERFMDLEPSFLEFMTDKLYNEMFEGKGGETVSEETDGED